MMPKFTWNEDKAHKNVRKHRISFRQAKNIWQGPFLTEMDDKQDYGEIRFNTVGVLPGTTTVLHVTHTETEDAIHIISARLATRRERESYYEQIG
jgi:uncharacterized DUF497 family protein